MSKTNRIKGKAVCMTLASLTLGGLAVPAAQAGILYVDFNQNLLTPDSSLFLFGAAGQSATVSSLSGFHQNVVLGADGFFSLSVPNLLQQSGTGIRNTGLKVESTGALGGYFVNQSAASTDMTYLFDEENLGSDYVVASHGTGYGDGSQIMVHATQDNTEITLDLATGDVINITLQEGETYKYAAGSNDLSGSRVRASANVAVFGGHSCANVPDLSQRACDVLIEQMIPTEDLSTLYHLTASQGASIAPSGTDIVKVIATADNTTVSINGEFVVTLDEGQVHQFDLHENSGVKIESSVSVMVAQYLEGGMSEQTDPAMALVPGADTWLRKYHLATPSGTSAFDVNYASVVINSTDLLSLMLDGVAVDTTGFTSISGSPFSRGIVNLPLGLFDLSAANPFLVMLGGGSSANSYFTFGGATFAPGISPPTSVAEPAMLSLFGLGGLLLAFHRRRNSGSRNYPHVNA